MKPIIKQSPYSIIQIIKLTQPMLSDLPQSPAHKKCKLGKMGKVCNFFYKNISQKIFIERKKNSPIKWVQFLIIQVDYKFLQDYHQIRYNKMNNQLFQLVGSNTIFEVDKLHMQMHHLHARHKVHSPTYNEWLDIKAPY